MINKQSVPFLQTACSWHLNPKLQPQINSTSMPKGTFQPYTFQPWTFQPHIFQPCHTELLCLLSGDCEFIKILATWWLEPTLIFVAWSNGICNAKRNLSLCHLRYVIFLKGEGKKVKIYHLICIHDIDFLNELSHLTKFQTKWAGFKDVTKEFSLL